MDDILQLLKFREFSYETDPESLVDLHRCMETLEGGWFDRSETCRMHMKVVARTPGSSWVLALSGTIFGHADLLNYGNGTGLVPRWRLHPDFRHAKVAGKLLEGIKEKALARNYSAIIFFADSTEAATDLQSLSLRRDRSYHLYMPDRHSEIETAAVSPVESLSELPVYSDISPFLGPPLLPAFVITRAVMGSDYGVFGFEKPRLYRITAVHKTYLACFDGREWFVFRTQKNREDRQALKPILNAIGKLHSGRILLSEKVLEALELKPSSDGIAWDFFTEL